MSAVDENDPQYALQQEINDKWNTDYLVGKLADPVDGIGKCHQ